MTNATAALTRPVRGASAWVPADLGSTGLPCIALSAEATEALLARGQLLRDESSTNDPVAVDDLGLASLVSDITAELDHGRGIVLLRRLPVEDLDVEAATFALMALGSALGIVRPHTRRGDDWIRLIQDESTVPSALDTSSELMTRGLSLHTDTSSTFHEGMPETIGQLLVRKAQEGGMSTFVSSHEVFNRLLAQDEDVVATLTEPFFWTRLEEARGDEAPVFRRPVFERHGSRDVVARYNHGWIRRGHDIAGVPLTADQQHALDALDAVLADPTGDLVLEYDCEPGEVILANNERILHGRTPFIDAGARDERRLLLHLYVERRGQA